MNISMGRKRRILFIDRDGTLLIEPADQQVDSLEKLELMPGVIPALLELRNAGYELVIVSNQDGLGTDSYPPQDFEIPQRKMLDLFESQGITFSAIHIDPHFEHQNAPTRKPGIGMLLGYLQSGDLDMEDSWVIGDRQTDLELAENLGISGLRIGQGYEDWESIAHHLVNQPRQAKVERKTNETDTRVFVDLDAGGSIQGVIAAADLALSLADESTRIIPGHGPLAMEEDLRDYRSFLVEASSNIQALMDQGMSLEQIIEARPTREWDETLGEVWITPPQFHTFIYNSLEGIHHYTPPSTAETE